MKIFEKDGKVNFVDDNNVLVGFDYSQERLSPWTPPLKR